MWSKRKIKKSEKSKRVTIMYAAMSLLGDIKAGSYIHGLCFYLRDAISKNKYNNLLYLPDYSVIHGIYPYFIPQNFDNVDKELLKDRTNHNIYFNRISTEYWWKKGNYEDRFNALMKMYDFYVEIHKNKPGLFERIAIKSLKYNYKIWSKLRKESALKKLQMIMQLRSPLTITTKLV